MAPKRPFKDFALVAVQDLALNMSDLSDLKKLVSQIVYKLYTIFIYIYTIIYHMFIIPMTSRTNKNRPQLKIPAVVITSFREAATGVTMLGTSWTKAARGTKGKQSWKHLGSILLEKRIRAEKTLWKNKITRNWMFQLALDEHSDQNPQERLFLESSVMSSKTCHVYQLCHSYGSKKCGKNWGFQFGTRPCSNLNVGNVCHLQRVLLKGS